MVITLLSANSQPLQCLKTGKKKDITIEASQLKISLPPSPKPGRVRLDVTRLDEPEDVPGAGLAGEELESENRQPGGGGGPGERQPGHQPTLSGRVMTLKGTCGVI